ncbi:hypothetical protein RhiirA5_437686 [Rhizophagus irregularis]|uniref:Uncharacterized protein n=1 Tax=Rhizophagus irregularis TaxID=588596 RepID=A0A2N0NK56_9GLOM|nr:hypothetical protein RhiirA5_437686 [Rhizophagus irregularis]
MAHWKDWYDIEIMHAIKRYVRIGFEIREGSDIENSIKDLYSSFTNYSSIQTRNLSKIEIMKPNLIISTPSVPKSLWTIPRLRINTPNENLVSINNRIVDIENNFNVNAEFQLASG